MSCMAFLWCSTDTDLNLFYLREGHQDAPGSPLSTHLMNAGFSEGGAHRAELQAQTPRPLLYSCQPVTSPTDT